MNGKVLTHELWPNQAAAVDAPMASPLHAVHHGRRATAQRR